ncbi:ImmA/IrrE family metallo-endopeptidase [Pseudofrankia sp. DC12]|uniref:ImmA/IrrE family metallo-endopeptidase n=1 Tax=Pseudofrankia sp. DC12 TaxID=683315 RepID=UPI000B305CD7|nr:ImmA/IrrE family metallo-endopeptidase [Pseudofrankia sp. DC12]
MATNDNILTKVREVIPARAITQGEALILAERQASLLMRMLDIREVPVDVLRISELPNIEVRVKPRHEMPEIAALPETSEIGGVTQVMPDGRTVFTINREDPVGRRRFSLAHELKHLLDDPIVKTAYVKLGYGSEDYRARQIERICDHFAACFLMPRSVLKRFWMGGLQDLEPLAEQFKVSMSAMQIRLKYLGLTDEAERPVSEYFRLDGSSLGFGFDCPNMAA